MKEIDKKCQKKIIRILFDIIIFILLYKAITSIVTGGEEAYDSLQSIMVWKGMIFLAISLVFISEVRFTNALIYVPSIIVFALFFCILVKSGYRDNSPDLWNWYINRAIAICIVLLVLTNSIFERKVLFLSKTTNWPFFVYTFLTFLVVVLLFERNSNTMYFFIFFLIIMISGFKVEQSCRLCTLLCLSDIVATVVLSVKSLFQTPYVGQTRYYGSFVNLHGFGMFVASGVICCFCLFFAISDIFRRVRALRILGYVFLGLSMSFLIMMTIIINSRNSLLGILISIITLCFMLSIKYKKTWIMVVGTLFVFFIVTTIVVLMFKLAPLVGDIKNPLLYYLARKGTMILETDLNENGIIKSKALMYFDTFTNGRIQIWITTIKNLKFFSGNNSEIWLGDFKTNVHNTFLGYLNIWGIVPGVLFCGVMIWRLISSFLNYLNLKKKESTSNKEEIVLSITIIMMTFCFSIFMNEMIYIKGLYIIICLLLCSLGAQKLSGLTNGDRSAE